MVLRFNGNTVRYLLMDIRPWVILFFAIEGQAEMLFSTYTRKPAFDNIIPKKGQLWSVSCRSRAECCIICQTDSKCISYFYKSSQCRGFPYMMTSYVATNSVPGLVYTDLNVVDSSFVVLLRGGWKDKIWLFSSTQDDRRNTLIALLTTQSSLGVNELQGRPDYGVSGSLSGMMAIFVCLRDNSVLLEATLITLSDVQQRQTIISFLGGATSLDQLSDHDLAKISHRENMQSDSNVVQDKITQRLLHIFQYLALQLVRIRCR